MRNTIPTATTIVLSYLLLSLFALSISGAGKQVDQRSQNGLNTITFTTPQGRVTVKLPDDIRPGDVISGSIVAVPTTPDSLNAHVIEIESKRIALADRILKFVTPAAGPISLILRDAAGTEVGRSAIPMRPANRASPSAFALPIFGQNGRPIEIIGAFDGDLSNTRCEVGAQRVAIIAESPRLVVIQLPWEPVGETTITINEGTNTKTGEFRTIGVRLTAPKTSLLKGEKTTLTVQATGLQGLKQNVPMDLVTTGAVDTEGGNIQKITIKPIDVLPDGSATLTRTLTGMETGNFNVTATLDPAKIPRKQL